MTPNSRTQGGLLAPLRLPAIVTAGALVLGAVVWLASGEAPAPAQTTVALPAQPATPTPDAAHPASTLWENVRIRAGDTLGRILSSRGHDNITVHGIMTSGAAAKELASIKAGTTLKVATDTEGNLSALSYSPDPYRVVNVNRDADGNFRSEVIEKPSMTVTRYAEGTIDDSLFASGQRAGLSDPVILELADAFGYDIDFALDIQEGDAFKVVYEEILVDGEKVRDGDILAAEFTNQGKTYRAIRFKTKDGRSAFYTPDGLAMHKAFLRTPVDFARISSGFSLHRFHPVLHLFRAHKGVDYAAARGTPVHATANGKIQYAGNQGGYGRVVIIQHNNTQSTLYGHLEGFAKGVRTGAKVSQGQIIGYVGSSGLASGPHLHYEFRVNGVHVDPLKVKTTQADPIAASEMPAFKAEASRLVAMLDSASGRTAVATAEDTRKLDAQRKKL